MTSERLPAPTTLAGGRIDAMSRDFYEADEPIEEIEAAVGHGEEVVTVKARDLNQRAAPTVNRAPARASADEVENLDVELVDETDG